MAQGLTVFMVSWKSADASMADVTLDDYVLRGQIDAIDTVRDLLGVPSVHAVGYCVAGTTLAATLALLATRGQADKVRSATFLTAQVDFTQAGDLRLFADEDQMPLIESLIQDGYLDGRYMAATFNLLRGQDLIWNYVVNNYLLGQDYPQFDLLYWNGDTTNLPARWFRAYLADLYRDNKLVEPGGIVVDGTPIDLRQVTTPAYVQAGIEDHIAPPRQRLESDRAFRGPGALPARRIGPYRRRRQSARRSQISVLDQRHAPGEPRRIQGQCARDQGKLVARLGRMDRAAKSGDHADDRRPRAGRGKICCTRRCPRPLCADALGADVRTIRGGRAGARFLLRCIKIFLD